jgi:hypothetical protein
MPAATLPEALMTTAVSTPEQATTEPTERSKWPEARQKSMVQESIPTVTTAVARPLMLFALAKFGTNSAQRPKMAAQMTAMPALSQICLSAAGDLFPVGWVMRTPVRPPGRR